jgi:ubiquinone/menaquinone biosynthesis C-methylase UbiE
MSSLEKEQFDAYSHWQESVNWQMERYLREEKAEKESNRPVKIFLTEIFNNFPDEKVLDVGSGLFSETYLPETHLNKTTKFDWINLNNQENFIVGNAENLPFENEKFGIVMSKQVYGYLENPDKVLEEMVRILKPEGLLVLIDWEGNLKKYKDRIKNFDTEKISDQIKSINFERVEIKMISQIGPILCDGIYEFVKLNAIMAKKNA